MNDKSKPALQKYIGQQKGAAKKHIIERLLSDPEAMVRVGRFLVDTGRTLNNINIFGLVLASRIAHKK